MTCLRTLFQEQTALLSVRKFPFPELTRISHQSSLEQARGEETADVLDRPRSPSFTASADPRFD